MATDFRRSLSDKREAALPNGGAASRFRYPVQGESRERDEDVQCSGEAPHGPRQATPTVPINYCTPRARNVSVSLFHLFELSLCRSGLGTTAEDNRDNGGCSAKSSTGNGGRFAMSFSNQHTVIAHCNSFTFHKQSQTPKSQLSAGYGTELHSAFGLAHSPVIRLRPLTRCCERCF